MHAYYVYPAEGKYKFRVFEHNIYFLFIYWIAYMAVMLLSVMHKCGRCVQENHWRKSKYQIKQYGFNVSHTKIYRKIVWKTSNK